MLSLLLSGHLAGSYGQRTMKKYGEIVLQLLLKMGKWAKDIGTDCEKKCSIRLIHI